MSLKSNTAWNLAGNGLPFLLGIFTIPYLVKHLGMEAIGILTLIWGLIGYFSLFDFGLGRALTHQVASSLSANKTENIPHLVKSGLAFTSITGLFGAVALLLFAEPLTVRWLKIDAELQEQTIRCFYIAAIGIPLTTVTTGLRGVLEAHEDFRAINFIRAGLGVASFGLPALCVMLIGPSLVWMVIALILARLLVLVAHINLVNKKLLVPWWLTNISFWEVKGLLSFGMWMTVTNIIGPLMVSADRFVISARLGAASVAYHTVPFEFMVRVLVIPAALSTALFPRLAFQFINNLIQARKTYLYSLKVISLILAPICMTLALFSYSGLSIWLGSDFAEKSWQIVCVLSLGVFLNGIATIPFAAIQGNGNARKTATLHLFELFVYLPLLIISLDNCGILGASLAWVARVAFDLIMLLIMAESEFNSKHHAID